MPAQWAAGQAQARPSSCFGPARTHYLSCRVVLVLGQILRAATLPQAKFLGLHVWLNMPIFFKMKVSSLVSYLGEGLALLFFLFYFVFFSEK
jgi:hypothetical protein